MRKNDFFKRGVLIPLTLILLMISFASAAQLYQENFYYEGSTYTSAGWFLVSSCANFPTVPVPSVYSSGAYGWNITNAGGCGGAFTFQLRRNFTDTLNTNGVLTSSFDYAILNDSDDSTVPLRFRIAKTYSELAPDIEIRPDGNITVNCNAQAGCTGCAFKHPDKENVTTGSIQYQIDLESEEYSVYLDGYSVTGCVEQAFSSADSELAGINLLIAKGNAEVLSAHIDNIIITSDDTTLTQLYDPCTETADCIFGICQGGVCVKLPDFAECTSSGECISERCVDGVCARSGVDQQLEEFKNQYIGSDSAGNVVSLILILLLMGGVMMGGLKYAQSHGSGGHLAAIVSGALALVVGFVAMILLSLIGWLSGWVVVIAFIFLLVVVVGSLFLFGEGGS